MGLLISERESELSQTRLEQGPHHLHMFGTLKEQTQIIRVAHQFGLAAKLRFDLPFEPEVYDIMEIDVGQQW